MSEIPIFGNRVEGVVCRYRPSAYAVVRNERGDFAVARTPVACFLPGGGIDPGETPEQAIEREGKEECGLVLRPCAFLGRAIEICYSISEQAHYEKNSVFFAADVVGNTKSCEPDHELEWLDAGQTIAALSHGSHRWAVGMVIARSES